MTYEKQHIKHRRIFYVRSFAKNLSSNNNQEQEQIVFFGKPKYPPMIKIPKQTMDHLLSTVQWREWQRKVVELLDNGQDMYVAAPAAAGKSFLANQMLRHTMAKSVCWRDLMVFVCEFEDIAVISAHIFDAESIDLAELEEIRDLKKRYPRAVVLVFGFAPMSRTHPCSRSLECYHVEGSSLVHDNLLSKL